MPSERRKYTRLTTDQNVQCAISGMDVVHVVGLSSGGSGMRVITNKELPDEEFDLELDLGDGQPPLRLRGKAVWHESWDFEFFNRHAAGVVVTGLQPGDSERIDALIQNPQGEPDPDMQAP